jgi:hypothetical protein
VSWTVCLYKGGAFGGGIGSITRSCNNYQACQVAGGGSTGGVRTDMKDCCNSYNGCMCATEKSLPAFCLRWQRKWPEKDIGVCRMMML